MRDIKRIQNKDNCLRGVGLVVCGCHPGVNIRSAIALSKVPSLPTNQPTLGKYLRYLYRRLSDGSPAATLYDYDSQPYVR